PDHDVGEEAEDRRREPDAESQRPDQDEGRGPAAEQPAYGVREGLTKAVHAKLRDAMSPSAGAGRGVTRNQPAASLPAQGEWGERHAAGRASAPAAGYSRRWVALRGRTRPL